MSKRTYLSGSEKKKRLEIQKENISKLLKLTSFFIFEETNRQTESLIPETEPTFDDITSVLNSSHPNLTADVNISELKSSSLSNCDLTTTQIIDNTSHDLSTYYDDIFIEEKRDI